MGDMHAGHDPVVVADDGLATALDCAAAEGAQFTDGGVVPDDQFGVLAVILRRLNFPIAPLILGIVLGKVIEKNWWPLTFR